MRDSTTISIEHMGVAAGVLSCCFVFWASSAFAAAIYLEDFSDTSEWFPVYNLNGGAATKDSDGNLGYFSVELPNNVVAFAPVFPLVTADIFNPAVAFAYTLRYEVANITYSLSYSIEIDQFDEFHNYISTVFNVAPEGTFVGSNSVSLRGYSWDGNAKYILPKVTVRTGDGNQTISFNNMEIEVASLPEPSSVLMMLLGTFFGLRVIRKKSRMNVRPETTSK